MPDGTHMLLKIIFIGVCVRSNMFVSCENNLFLIYHIEFI